jgi:XTP/dITP diphosphohydrolase
MIKLCFATNNHHKVEEVRQALNEKIELLTLDEINCFEELPETMPTLEGNSLQKATYVFNRYAIPCFADDTGLEVEALNGQPGVYSARYAGPQKNSDDNVQRLLEKLSGHANRKARFRTIFSLVGLEEHPVIFEGIVNGSIATEKKGSSGFGYDPVFIPEGSSITFAEMNLSQKNSISHRAIATQKLVNFLKSRIRNISKIK